MALAEHVGRGLATLSSRLWLSNAVAVPPLARRL